MCERDLEQKTSSRGCNRAQFSRSTDQLERSILTHSVTMEMCRNKQSRSNMQRSHRLYPLFIVITSVWSGIRGTNTDSHVLRAANDSFAFGYIILVIIIYMLGTHLHDITGLFCLDVLACGLILTHTSTLADNYYTHSQPETLTALRKMHCYSNRRVCVSCDSTVLGWIQMLYSKTTLLVVFPKNWLLPNIKQTLWDITQW